MGLDCSHDAFHGAYSAFNRLRQFVCHAIGGSFPPHWKYDEHGVLIERFAPSLASDMRDMQEGMYYAGEYTNEEWPGLHEFLGHSDCGGEISPESCVIVANDLERLLPEMQKLKWRASGHIEGAGGYIAVINRFIAGCRKAAENNEPLRFG